MLYIICNSLFSCFWKRFHLPVFWREYDTVVPTSVGSQKKQELQKNIYFCFIVYAKAFDFVDHNKLWKTLKGMGIPDHLTCLLSNLYTGQEATVKTGHGTTDWFQIRKGVHHGCILSLCLFNFYAEYTMWNAGLDETQAGIKIARRNIITSDMQMTPPLCQKVKKNEKASWWKWKRRMKMLA